MNIFISYHYSEAHDYMEALSSFLYKSFDNIYIKSEKIDYRHKGYSDEGIRTIIRDYYMKDCELVIILLSKNAWKRKHIDWEISTTLRDTRNNSRKGVIVILLPEYGKFLKYETNQTPIRIIKNVNNGYMETIKWSEINASTMKHCINKAIINSKKILPIDNDTLRRKNRNI